MVPPSLKGKEFETLILEAARREEASGGLTLSRYGVQGVTFGDKTILGPSLPDFEGVLAGGRQIIIEAKACKTPGLELRDKNFKDRQYSHMAKRAEFGSLCFLLIHFAERQLVTKRDPGMTVAVPVNARHPFWMLYETGERRTLSREEALTIGQAVPWIVPKGCRKPLPDLLSFLWPEARKIQLSTAQPTLFP